MTECANQSALPRTAGVDWNRFFCWGESRFRTNIGPPNSLEVAYMRMLESVEFADAGTMTGKHPVLAW
jgi:hypothetical protein